jgi:NADH:ubiquinone reductase (H+-translocating)
MTNNQLPHVVIVGGGFAGLAAARSLRNAPVHITLIDRSNHYLFQPSTLSGGDRQPCAW